MCAVDRETHRSCMTPVAWQRQCTQIMWSVIWKQKCHFLSFHYIEMFSHFGSKKSPSLIAITHGSLAFQHTNRDSFNGTLCI